MVPLQVSGFQEGQESRSGASSRAARTLTPRDRLRARRETGRVDLSRSMDVACDVDSRSQNLAASGGGPGGCPLNLPERRFNEA